MDALIRWMIAISWTVAGISLSFATYTHPIDWIRFNINMAEIDAREKFGDTTEAVIDFQSEEKRLQYRKFLDKRWMEYFHRTETARQNGIRLWWIATALFSLNALGLIVIHKKGFNPASKTAVTQTPSPPSP